MADRAEQKDDDPYAGIVDLNKDDRWQERLAEARARREIALREKELSGGAARRKPKPWETDAGDDPDEFSIEPLLPQAKTEPDPDRVDFSDRVGVLRKSRERSRDPDGVRSEPKPERKRSLGQDDFAELFADIPLEDPDPGPVISKPLERERENSLIAADAPDIAAVAARVSSTSRARREAPVDEVNETEPEAQTAPQVMSITVRQRPFGLAFGILVLALLPFATQPPPLRLGPPVFGASVFGIQPALGLTSAMLWRPVETTSGDWVPPHLVPPAGPVEKALDRPAEITLDIQPMGVPAAGEVASGDVVPGWEDGAPILPQVFGRPLEPFSDAGYQGDVGHDLGDVRPLPRPTGEGAVDEATVVVPRDVSGELSNVTLTAVSSATPLTVTVLVPAIADGSAGSAIADEIRTRGHAVARIKTVDMKISARNVRYFHASDRPAAAALAAAFGAELKDFSWFSPSPVAGTVEVWLSHKDG